MSENSYDLIVLGGGPGGYAAAISAAKEGLSVLLFEGEYIGGTCLNVGCIPTKYLLDKAALMEKIKSLTEEKIFRDAGLYSFKKIQDGRKAVVDKLVGKVEYLLKANKVTVIKKFARLKEAGKVSCGGEEYYANDIIIATGSKPAIVPIEGVEHAIDSTKALKLAKVPRRLVVIGGGVIGMELASAYRSYGSEVTVIEFLPELYGSEDQEMAAYLKKELVKRGIKILCGTSVSSIEKLNQELAVSFQGKEKGRILADTVLMATGRKANLQGVDAQAAGICLTGKNEIQVNQYMETSVPHIYAIGDVVGGYQLAHAAYAEGEAAVDHILGRAAAVDLSAMPRCIYTMPAFAAVGISRQKAEADGIETVSRKFSYGANGMALAEGAEGMVQVLMDQKTQTTLGIQIVGECAPELIAFAALAVKNKTSLEEWQKMIVAHPSLAEMIKEAALDCFGKSVHGAVK